MTTMYLNQKDVDDFGHELLDVSQRAALQAVTPQLEYLQQQNVALQQQVARDRRRRLDSQVATLVPNYREIDNNPRWHTWLLGVDLMSGRVRQGLLDEAIADGDARRVQKFFNDFQQQDGRSPGSRTSSRRSAASAPFYTRDRIKELYEQHRKGAFNGREADWNAIEQDLFAAQREGRVEQRPYLTK
jgi:hypothetical protein